MGARTAFGGGGSSIALVGTPTVGEGVGSSTTIASAAKATTTGNLIVVPIHGFTGGNTITGCVDTASNTYAQATGAYADGVNGLNDIWYAKNITGHAANVVTCTFANASLFRSIHQIEYSGASTTAPFDTAALGQATSSTSVTSASFSPSSGSVNVAITSQGSTGSDDWVAGTNYTKISVSGSSVNTAVEHRLAAPGGAQTASITFSLTNLQMSVASFKP
jgi:hypothetical protein